MKEPEGGKYAGLRRGSEEARVFMPAMVGAGLGCALAGLVAYLVAPGAVLATAPPPGSSAARPVVLFTVPLGHGAGQVGFEPPEEGSEDYGPEGLRAGPAGWIYIGDWVNGCIKVFDRRGKLVARTAGRLDDFLVFVVDREGSIYVLDTKESEEWLRKFGADGRRLWSVTSRSLGVSFSPQLVPMNGGGVAVSTESGTFALVTAGGKLARILKADGVTPGGEIAEERYAASGRWSFAVRFSKPASPPGPWTTCRLAPTLAAEVESLGSEHLDVVAYDGAGLIDCEAVGPKGVMFLQFDRTGRLRCYGREPTGPYDYASDYDSDDKGDIYCLEIRQRTLRVIRFRAGGRK